MLVVVRWCEVVRSVQRSLETRDDDWANGCKASVACSRQYGGLCDRGTTRHHTIARLANPPNPPTCTRHNPTVVLISTSTQLPTPQPPPSSSPSFPSLTTAIFLPSYPIMRPSVTPRRLALPLILSLLLSLSASYLVFILRTVPLRHILFVLLISLYALFANVFLRRKAPTPLPIRSLAPGKNVVRLLFPFTMVFSLLVPFILLFIAGISPVDNRPSHLAHILSPHLYLVIAQICLETVGFIFASFFTLYVRLGVTIALVTYRIPILFAWYYDVVAWAKEPEVALYPAYTVPLAQTAAVLNIVFWLFALLCFLLLYCLPAVMRQPMPTTSPSSTTS